MNRIGRSKNGRFELAQTQVGTKKEPIKKALDLNGGNDEARFELFKQYYKHLNNTQTTQKIYYLISSLSVVA
jgi:hypothetical protein